MRTVVVGFGHKARHGKDYAAGVALEYLSRNWVVKRYSFAEELKIEFYDALLTPLHPFWAFCPDYLKITHPRGSTFDPPEVKLAWIEEHRKDIVAYLQPYGTEFRRHQDPVYWVRRVKKAIERDEPQVALIPDMRFMNEYLFVKANKGYTVKVSRFDVDSDGNELPFVDPNRDPNHPSENELNSVLFDFEIRCQSGHLDELTADTITVVNELIARETKDPGVFGDATVIQAVR